MSDPSLAEVLAATDEYVGRTGRRVSFEYTLMASVNDSDALADELALHIVAGDLLPAARLGRSR